MKKLLLVFYFSFFIVLGQAQKADISLNIGASMNYRNLWNTMAGDDLLSENLFKNKADDKILFQPILEVAYRKWLNERHALLIGGQYLNMKYVSSHAYFNFPTYVDSNGLPLRAKTNYINIDIHSASVPIIYHYNSGTIGQWKCINSAGIVPTYIFSQKRIYEYEVQGFVDSEMDFAFDNAFPEISFSARLGLRFEYEIAESISMVFTPDFTYNFGTLEIEGTRENLFQTALKLGIAKQF